MTTRLSVTLPGLKMKNPVMPASGTFGFGDMYHDLYDYNHLGAIVVKSTTLEARKGNEDPKYHPLPSGALNAVGLKNPGVDAVVKDKLPRLQTFDTPVIGSAAGSSEDEYVQVAVRLAESGLINALELNLSCPNVKEGGLTFGADPQVVQKIIRQVKQAVNLPVYVKLTPNVTDVTAIALAAEAGGADGISLINTVLGMNFDVKTRRPVLGNVMGGLSGESVFPIAIRMVYQVSRAVSIPVIGMGGIQSVDDAIQMFLAGASAVAIGTATYKNPVVMNEIIRELPGRLSELGIDSLEELIREVKEGEIYGQ
ncbi:Dihydroorotate dehydrogenase, catalytic subunit [Alkalibacterium sp. AK22]|uniref:dihydroorotate dehydrogenase n=1 Tax=Alkalibacterium sp. AK22 TaxID=1229520 RepID=UPI00045156ED|nr:dihydroorotate dehydrogenase [Alkalibacterium sp. AK22]EXJ24259.1 Dihydroorotate dehydrogenase, catalytic subunit [Alkalibacterium sp. AK22]